MKSDPPAPADLTPLLRQQLLLAQVRIMELEDERDELETRLGTTRTLLSEAQTIAESKATEATHLEDVRAALEKQHEHLRHTQHLTHEALTQARTENTALTARHQELLGELDQLHVLTRQLAQAEREHRERGQDLAARVAEQQAELAARLQRMQELDGQLRTMKASRSWRWTAWLRAIERSFQ